MSRPGPAISAPLETSIDAFLAKVVAAMQSEGGTPTRLVREEER